MKYFTDVNHPISLKNAYNLFKVSFAFINVTKSFTSIPAIFIWKIAKSVKNKIIVINISGRGDKDCAAIARYRGEDIYE